jgi:hypothetical protein
MAVYATRTTNDMICILVLAGRFERVVQKCLLLLFDERRPASYECEPRRKEIKIPNLGADAKRPKPQVFDQASVMATDSQQK